MKILISIFISCLPFNVIRVFAYKTILGYQIDQASKIGMFNCIVGEKVKIHKTRIKNFNYILAKEINFEKNTFIGKFNRIKFLNQLFLNEGVTLVKGNFIGGSRFKENLPFQNCLIGKNSAVLRGNYFDVTQSINIGENVVFGGNGSEIWTHGFDTNKNRIDGAVVFENNIFIGSRCIFSKNIKICSNVTIAPASVVYKSIDTEGVYSSQKLYKIK